MEIEKLPLITARELKFPAFLRSIFEREIDGTVGKPETDFNHVFRRSLNVYRKRVATAVKKVLLAAPFSSWLRDHGVELITWHYKTRHPAEAAFEEEWFSDQVALAARLRSYVARGDLMPYRSESPYIEVFAKEQNPEGFTLIYIDLPEKKRNAADPNASVFTVPPGLISNLIILSKRLEHSINESDVESIRAQSQKFFPNLRRWMKSVGGGRLDDLGALRNLMASLKVTLTLLGNPKYSCRLPRSVFLCPAYVGGEKVGGMAFTCSGRVAWDVAILVESVATSLLSYLRLREDALAHTIIEEMNELDQAKRIFMHRLTHDFRHPIEALRSTVKDMGSLLQDIDRQFGHFEDVMNRTLLAIEGGSASDLLRPRRRIDNVNEFIADIAFFFKRQFEANGKQLTIAPMNKMWQFAIDRGIFREIIENLVANALEHGGDEAQLRAEFIGNHFFIHVEDNGTGVSASDRSKIFFPFYLRPVKMQRGDGPVRGRGLAISKLLAENHEANIYFKSTDNNYYNWNGQEVDSLAFTQSEWNCDFVVEVDKGY